MAAFELFKAYVTGQKSSEPERKASQSTETDHAEEDATFFGKFSHNKPADNAKLLAANHYRNYGSEAFSTDETRQGVADVGLTVPERLDMTFLGMREKGNSLFTRAGRGKFRPTVHGEANLKSEYSIKKGTKAKPKPAADK